MTRLKVLSIYNQSTLLIPYHHPTNFLEKTIIEKIICSLACELPQLSQSHYHFWGGEKGQATPSVFPIPIEMKSVGPPLASKERRKKEK